MNKNIKKEYLDCWLNLIKGKCSPGELIKLPVLSGSMMPYLIPGKTIEIKPSNHKETKFGDIIVFKEGKILTSHRLLLKLKIFRLNLLFQKGDSNRFGNWIKPEQVVGLVASYENDEGKRTVLLEGPIRKKIKMIAIKQLLNCMLNILLIPLRGIKRCMKMI